MKIFKSKNRDGYVTAHELIEGLSLDTQHVGNKIGISWRVKKRRKLRSYHIEINRWECDCCGPTTSLKLTKGNKSLTLTRGCNGDSLYSMTIDSL